jgi:PleD family two-component response regulator
VRESGHLERIIKYAAYIIGRTVRVIDNVAFLGGGRFAVLLAETDKAVAGQAARRILRAVRHDVAACFDFEVDVYAGLTEYGGQPLDALIDGCMRTIASAKTAQVAR